MPLSLMPDGPAPSDTSERIPRGMRKRSSKSLIGAVSTADPRRSMGAKMALSTVEKLCVQLNSLEICKPKLRDLAKMMDARWRSMRERRQRQGHVAETGLATPRPTTLHRDALEFVGATVEQARHVRMPNMQARATHNNSGASA